jgi:hypothetical protein
MEEKWIAAAVDLLDLLGKDYWHALDILDALF